MADAIEGIPAAVEGATATPEAPAATDSQPIEADITEVGGASADTDGDDNPAEITSSDGPPEAYQDFSLPEGVQLPPDMIGEFKSWAKESGLTQDKAQDTLDQGTKIFGQFQNEQIQKLNSTWQQQVTSDPLVGGAKLEANLAIANKALGLYGDKQFITELRQSPYGNNPGLTRLLYRIGLTLQEDTKVPQSGSGNNNSAGRDPAKALYGNMA